MGIRGLLLGFASSHFLQGILFLRLLLVLTDWNATSEKAVERIEEEMKSIKDKK